MTMPQQQQPIGVFDSGVGGLTVLSALQQALPEERFIYLGDTARLPYGTKSAETVNHYALQTARLLVARGIKCLVVACNTASTLALDTLQTAFPDLPIIGVVQPGAQAAVQATRNHSIAVIATEATVQAQGYQQALATLNPQVNVIAKSCGLYVALAEEGWVDDDIAVRVTAKYLTPLLTDNQQRQPDTLVLGCTHFPVFKNTIRNFIGSDITLVDSAEATAQAVAALLQQQQLCGSAVGIKTAAASTHYLVTDNPERFCQVAAYFLKQPLSFEQIELVDYEPLFHNMTYSAANEHNIKRT